jgi:hypothetical protein
VLDPKGTGHDRHFDCTKAPKEQLASICRQLREKNVLCPDIARLCTDCDSVKADLTRLEEQLRSAEEKKRRLVERDEKERCESGGGSASLPDKLREIDAEIQRLKQKVREARGRVAAACPSPPPASEEKPTVSPECERARSNERVLVCRKQRAEKQKSEAQARIADDEKRGRERSARDIDIIKTANETIARLTERIREAQRKVAAACGGS